MQLLKQRALWRIFDIVWLAAWVLYVIGGMEATPLHGDEPTQISMSRDYYYVVQTRDFDSVKYRDPALLADPSMQELRIINGTVNKMTIGFAWDMAGLTVNDVNEQWVWEWSREQNEVLGHMPGPRLFDAARWPSTLFTAISVIAVFGIAWLAGGGRAGAWIAAAIYATQPAVLVNGRRAMMEGSLMCFTVLTVLAGLLLIRAQRRADPRPWRMVGWSIALGVAGGLAISSKHPAAITITLTFLAVLLEPLTRPGNPEFDLAAHIRRLALASALVFGIFFALNPAWWNEPAEMPRRVLDARSGLLDSQVAWYGGYDNVGECLAELGNQMFLAPAQHFEVAVWDEYISDEIHDYERSGWAGRAGGWLWGLPLLIAFGLGTISYLLRWRENLLMLLWLGGTAGALLVLTPMAWQRYYLLINAPVAVFAGCGVAWLVNRRWLSHSRTQDA